MRRSTGAMDDGGMSTTSGSGILHVWTPSTDKKKTRRPASEGRATWRHWLADRPHLRAPAVAFAGLAIVVAALLVSSAVASSGVRSGVAGQAVLNALGVIVQVVAITMSLL